MSFLKVGEGEQSVCRVSGEVPGMGFLGLQLKEKHSFEMCKSTWEIIGKTMGWLP